MLLVANSFYEVVTFIADIVTISHSDSRCSEADENSDELWTNKYSPSTLSQLLVRKGYVDIINEWLLNWKRDIIKGQSANRNRVKKKSNKKRNQFINGWCVSYELNSLLCLSGSSFVNSNPIDLIILSLW